MPSKVRPAFFLGFATNALNVVAGAAAIAFNVGATFASRHDLDQQWKAEKSGAKTLPHWERLIGMAQHWISERTLAIAGLVVVPISDLKTALHFQPAAIRGVPGAQQTGKVAIENKMVRAARMFDRNVDLALRGFKGDFGRFKNNGIFF